MDATNQSGDETKDFDVLARQTSPLGGILACQLHVYVYVCMYSGVKSAAI